MIKRKFFHYLVNLKELENYDYFHHQYLIDHINYIPKHKFFHFLIYKLYDYNHMIKMKFFHYLVKLKELENYDLYYHQYLIHHYYFFPKHKYFHFLIYKLYNNHHMIKMKFFHYLVN